MSDLVGNPEDRFSRVAAQILLLPFWTISIAHVTFSKVFFFTLISLKMYSVNYKNFY